MKRAEKGLDSGAFHRARRVNLRVRWPRRGTPRRNARPVAAHNPGEGQRPRPPQWKPRLRGGGLTHRQAPCITASPWKGSGRPSRGGQDQAAPESPQEGRQA
ncbi:hypothetical protein Pisl_1408 [Pyrobaculum islandicum DSM 4184]|uniref:Uncharacterized protein n=1 Tax=Pyrobaculum islandicum (strain DSM 4184 / JCM 9189 / GEO3) TaxID=384616 RepID=A1RUD5_PYRIL|nr:hypothetical protein Pisl_1408 [Pyrobaculum islandicum DSM 4184]